MNTRFNYLYRDASNYKSWGEVVFSGCDSARGSQRIRAALDGGEFFIADQIRIPERFFDGWPQYADDHCFHEFDSLEPTDEPADDLVGRSITEFVSEVEQAGRTGWRVFDPQERRSKRPR